MTAGGWINEEFADRRAILREIARGTRARTTDWTPSDTGLDCPECGRPTITRFGGEWCRWCRGFIEALTLFYAAAEGRSAVIRVLRGRLGRR